MKMQLVNQSLNTPSGSSGGVNEFTDCIDTAINLLSNITEVACEHSADLDPVRLLNFMDLYRAYLSEVKSHDANQSLLKVVSKSGAEMSNTYDVSTLPATFEQFIGDSRLLQSAAAIATTESGETVAVPAPLRVSANADIDLIQ